jgi:FtsH-binding integral membrane protein
MVLVAVTVALFTLGAYLARDLSSGSAAGDATRRDFSGLARGLWWALVALIAFGVVLVFVSIPGGSVVYAVLGLTRRAGHGRLPARPDQAAARP